MRFSLNEMSARDFIDLARDDLGHISFSQFGEDLFLEILFQHRTDGFYVDIGAHDPRRFSNTFLLHRSGWRGINVDLDPQLIEKFCSERPTDINLVEALSARREHRVINLSNDSAVNTISKVKAVSYPDQWRIVEERSVETSTLAEILDLHVPPGVKLDLLDVDVEGVDLEVLQGNDWERWRPSVVLVEVEGLQLDRALESPIVSFMAGHNYRLASYLHVSAFFCRND